MLQTLSIKNVALIKDLTIDFEKGLNILLGETGAGKSIIFDALNFALGAKADKTLIRSGENVMRVDALFSGLSNECMDNLSKLGFEENEIVLSRTFTIEGKSTIRINGLPSTQIILKEVGKVLVDSYSQHESIELLKSKNHLLMLDEYGNKFLCEIKENVRELYQQCTEIKNKISRLGGNEFERERTISLLDYQINEIEDANLKIGEDEAIQERLKILNNAEKIFEAISLCEEILSDNTTSCISSLKQTSTLLAQFTSFNKLYECKERLDSAMVEIDDIYQTLIDIKDETEYDEKEFEYLDKRNDLIKSIKRKYGGTLEKVFDFLSESKNALNELRDSEKILRKLESELQVTETKLLSSCETLSNARKKISKDIELKIISELNDLGMKSSRFEIQFKRLENPTANGIDEVEFVFSANKGQEVKALTKTASGGELSRFMLAIKNIFSEIKSAQTLIFDEIDAGISGETGNIVGLKLSNITKFSQVLCITHLPQVASYGDSFYYISKIEDNKTTKTSLEKLEGDKILINLARMVVGENITDTALKQACEMRNKAKSKV